MLLSHPNHLNQIKPNQTGLKNLRNKPNRTLKEKLKN